MYIDYEEMAKRCFTATIEKRLLIDSIILKINGIVGNLQLNTERKFRQIIKVQ